MFIAYSLTFVQDTKYIVSKIYLDKGMMRLLPMDMLLEL
jgi:hypothetical protein